MMVTQRRGCSKEDLYFRGKNQGTHQNPSTCCFLLGPSPGLGSSRMTNGRRKGTLMTRYAITSAKEPRYAAKTFGTSIASVNEKFSPVHACTAVFATLEVYITAP